MSESEWNGEGLPPVGIPFEFSLNGFTWEGRTMLYNDGITCLMAHTKHPSNRWHYKCDDPDMHFRPLKSHRDRVIEKAMEYSLFGCTNIESSLLDKFANNLYDAGMLVDSQPKRMSRAEAFELVCEVVASGDSMICPECNGDRAVLSNVTSGPDGPIENFEDCDTCGGRGLLETDINQIIDALGYTEDEE